jgi:hypothetical protein
MIFIGENGTEGLMEVYPNPFTTQIQLKLPGDDRKLKVTLSDVLGRTVKEVELNHEKGKQDLILFGEGEAPEKGSYLLKVESGAGLWYRKLIRE